jgi:hypothetical protein
MRARETIGASFRCSPQSSIVKTIRCPLHLQRVYSENLVIVVLVGQPTLSDATQAFWPISSRRVPAPLAGTMRREFDNFRFGRRPAMDHPALHSTDDVQFCRINDLLR